MKRTFHHGDTASTAKVKNRSLVLRRAAVFAVVHGLCFSLAFAAKGDNRAELKELRGRIGALQKDLAKNETFKSNAAAELRKLDAAIAATNRQLDVLNGNRDRVQAQLDDLNRQTTQLSAQIETQQQQISRLLYRQFLSGNQDALHILLSGNDPNKAARDRYFLTLVSREKGDLLDDMRATLKEKNRLSEAARDKHDELAAIEKQQERERADLLGKQKERQTLLAQVSKQIAAQKQQISTLKENEKRLSSLIDKLAREQAARSAAKKKRESTGAPPSKGRPAPEPDLGRAKGEFAALRGKLSLPANGEVAQRFGTPRGEGGGIWKGLFIRCAPGSEVEAVADGTVVYADWLRGYGNLVIIDHDDGFLSVYGNNQSLLRRTGSKVKAREAIATAGGGGDGEESGLYFELRHQGQPFDPLRWTRLK